MFVGTKVFGGMAKFDHLSVHLQYPRPVGDVIRLGNKAAEAEAEAGLSRPESVYKIESQ